jgi:phospholipid/cholesterol/gamma-HCH transport system permease protein
MDAKTKAHVFGTGIDAIFLKIYNATIFVIRFFKEVFLPPYHFREIIRQCYEVGFKSLPLVTLTGFVIGIVFTKQSRPSLMEFGAVSWLPSLISIAIIRALAPLVTALIGAGKIGSSIGAELGSMKVTEQIDAMEVSAVNAFKFLVVTRVVATTIMIPILTMYCGFVGMIGSFININLNEMTSFTTFYEEAFSTISFLDIFSALIKSVFYGFTIGLVGSYNGFNASQGTESVGKAANSSVVTSMFLVFTEEVIFVQITNTIRTL